MSERSICPECGWPLATEEDGACECPDTLAPVPGFGAAPCDSCAALCWSDFGSPHREPSRLVDTRAAELAALKAEVVRLQRERPDVSAPSRELVLLRAIWRDLHRNGDPPEDLSALAYDIFLEPRLAQARELELRYPGVLSKQEIPKDAFYKTGRAPEGYRCKDCGAHGCKLWREYQTMACNITLRCSECACKDQEKDYVPDERGRHEEPHVGRSDQIGWLVPAVPTPENDTYWGYTSVPMEGVAWWCALPTRLP